MVTTESLFQGQIRIRQKKKGYRFSTDAIILAHHISPRKNDLVVDLGAGCGILSIVLAHRNPLIQCIAIELQADLASLTEENVRLNGMADRIEVIHGDMKNIQAYVEPGSADVVFSNPPYRQADAGRISPNQERAFARHELGASLADVMSAAARALKDAGRLSIIYPADRFVDLVTQMRAFGLEPKRTRIVHSKRGSSAELVYVEGVKEGSAGMEVLAPLIVHEDDDRFTIEMERMMA